MLFNWILLLSICIRHYRTELIISRAVISFWIWISFESNNLSSNQHWEIIYYFSLVSPCGLQVHYAKSEKRFRVIIDSRATKRYGIWGYFIWQGAENISLASSTIKCQIIVVNKLGCGKNNKCYWQCIKRSVPCVT